MRAIVAIFLVLQLPILLKAQEVLSVEQVGVSEAEDAATAKADIFSKVIEKVSLEHITAMIGIEKAASSKSIIENKVLKDTTKYILFTKGGAIKKVNGGFEMPVELRVSLKNLRDVLLKEGLLYQIEGPPKVLPVVRMVDGVSAAGYSWWSDQSTSDNAFLRKLMDEFHAEIKTAFHGIGFYSLSPINSQLQGTIPEAFRVDMPQRADLLFLGQFLKTSLVLRGEIFIRPKANTENMFTLDYRILGLHSGNGRVMAEVIRTYDCDPGDLKRTVAAKFKETAEKVTQDLAAQLSEGWKSGTFGANLYRLTLKSTLPPRDVSDFKKLLILRVREIKTVKERLLEAGSVTYEMDSSALPQQLAEVFKTKQFDKYKVQVDGVAADGMTIEVTKSL